MPTHGVLNFAADIVVRLVEKSDKPVDLVSGFLAESPYRLEHFLGGSRSADRANPGASQGILEGCLQTCLWVACYARCQPGPLDSTPLRFGLGPARELQPSRRAAIMVSRFHGKANCATKETGSRAHGQRRARAGSPTTLSACRPRYLDRQAGQACDSP